MWQGRKWTALSVYLQIVIALGHGCTAALLVLAEDLDQFYQHPHPVRCDPAVRWIVRPETRASRWAILSRAMVSAMLMMRMMTGSEAEKWLMLMELQRLLSPVLLEWNALLGRWLLKAVSGGYRGRMLQLWEHLVGMA